MLEGSVFVAGAVVQWLRDGLGLFARSDDVEALARQVDDHGDVFLVPGFAGLGAPHWDAEARGAIVGLTRGTTKAHIARAALQSIAFQSADVLAAMQRDAHQPLTEVRVDGGAAKNDLLLQFQADITGVPVVRPEVTETTALGAAYLAGLATRFLERPRGNFRSMARRAPLRACDAGFATRRADRALAQGSGALPILGMTAPAVIERERLLAAVARIARVGRRRHRRRSDRPWHRSRCSGARFSHRAD